MTTTVDATQLNGKYTIDPTHTSIGFIARHAMVTKVRGAFNEFTGDAYIDVDEPSNSSVEVSIKADSIDTRNTDRDGHLRSNDFLEMDKYPTIDFKSTNVARTGEYTVDITGDLTVKGVTKSLTVPFTFDGQATDPFGNNRVGFEGSVIINRKDFGITWNAALETGGVLIGEKITLEFEISAIKQS